MPRESRSSSRQRQARRQTEVSRRDFLAAGSAGASLTALALVTAARGEPAGAAPQDLPLVDFHVHLDNSTIDKALEVSRARGVKFGIVEHAGTKANKYPVVLSNDEELSRYLAMLDGKPVFRGVQAEWTDWTSGFSTRSLARLDYILMDAMTFPGKDGQRVKLWEKEAESRVDMADHEVFMDRFVDWHVELMERLPIDIFANFSWLPARLAKAYDALWTPDRMRRVVEAMAKHAVAMEIAAGLRLPKLPFLRMAKEAGVKICFGSNGRYPNMGRLDYCLEMARQVGLTPADMFAPAADGRKAVQRRSSASGTSTPPRS